MEICDDATIICIAGKRNKEGVKRQRHTLTEYVMKLYSPLERRGSSDCPSSATRNELITSWSKSIKEI
jgi:hypothetical protein